MIRSGLLGLALLAGACSSSDPADQTEVSISQEDLRSGYAFLTPQTQALQEDVFANPGYLWVDQGRALLNARNTESPSCVSCHEVGFRGVAARYPAVDTESGRLMNLEARINQCRTVQQGLTPLAYESEELLALTAAIAAQSRGLPLSVSTHGSAEAYYEKGKDYFFTRRGQFNFSCHQCHNENWGRRLRGDTISQGHLNGFPAYRLEWQALGSSHRRIRDCDIGVRAEPLPYGDETYIALELYLAARAQGLALESPAIRR